MFAQLITEVLQVLGIQIQALHQELKTLGVGGCFCRKFNGQGTHFFLARFFQFLGKHRVLLHQFLHGLHGIGGVLQQCVDRFQCFQFAVDHAFSFHAGYGFDPANARSQCSFTYNAERSDHARSWHVCSTAEFNARPEFHHADFVAIFLTEERHGTQLLGFFNGHISLVIEGDVFRDHRIHFAFDVC